MSITGVTRLSAILGDPLHKARTPERFNALFAERGIDAVVVPAEVDAASFDAAFDAGDRPKTTGRTTTAADSCCAIQAAKRPSVSVRY
jgi:shikimate 5-dehydrogenase